MDKTTGIMASSTNRVMEKPLHQDQQPLKCPRCDSLNTKFCYYNNYSLSQPRHFCKACKRYWTRGGTLRNVPVGGGYRKNKKMKKASSAGNDSAPQQNPIISSSLSHHQLDNIATSHLSPMFYGLSGNSYSEFPFPRFGSRNSYSETLPTSGPSYEEYGGSGFNHATQFQDLISSSNSIFSNLSLLGSSTSSPAYASASLISLQQQKQAMGGKDARPTSNFHAQLIPYEGLQMARNGNATMVMDEVKMEEGYRKGSKMEWTIPCLNQTELVGASDTTAINWNSTSAGAWPDLSNYGSSVTPLI